MNGMTRYAFETLNTAELILDRADRPGSQAWLQWCEDARIVAKLLSLCEAEWRRIDRYKKAMKSLPQYKTEEGAERAQARIHASYYSIEQADKYLEALEWWIEWHTKQLEIKKSTDWLDWLD